MLHQGILASLLALLLGRVSVVSCSVQSSGLSSQVSLPAIDTTKSGAVRAPIPSRTPPTLTKCDSRGTSLFRPLLTQQDLISVPISTSSNHSYPTPPIPQARLAPTRLHRPLLIRMLSLTAAAVVLSQPPTSTLSTTMLEVHRSRSSLVVLVLQNSPRHTLVDLKINLRLGQLLAVPATPILPTGDHDLVLPLVNPVPGTSNRLMSCKM